MLVAIWVMMSDVNQWNAIYIRLYENLYSDAVGDGSIGRKVIFQFLSFCPLLTSYFTLMIGCGNLEDTKLYLLFGLFVRIVFNDFALDL